MRVFFNTVSFNLFFIQRYKLEKLPTIRLAVVSTLIKQERDYITAIATYCHFLTSVRKCKHGKCGKFS